MRLNYIYIDGYKNLSKLEIVLDSESSMIGFIGNNGSGKSNILEALTIIFSKVKAGVPVEFLFCIKYSIDQKAYEISNSGAETVVLCNEKKLSKNSIQNALPGTVFLYYCGETARLKELSLSFVDREFENALKLQGNTVFKFLSYITVDDFGAALLANYVFENQTCARISEIVNIESIVLPIVIKLKRPYWASRGNSESLWNAVGAVRSEIDKLISISSNQRIQASNDSVEIIIMNLGALRERWYSALNLFISLKMLSQAGILDCIEFDVTKKNNPQIFSYTNLSEGEKQLSQLLSLLDITKEHKALFLLDEFDSYLHPNWQRKFADIIRSIDMKGQVLFTTHSPLTLSKMNKEEIVILKDGKAFCPAVSTYNRDASEVMEELMEVGKRPPDVEELINKFRNSALHAKKEEALKYYEELKVLLKEDDPFFVTSDRYISRLG